MTHAVVFTPEAQDQILALYRYIADSTASPEVAARYVEAVVECCEQLQTFPLRGIQRDDMRPGLRTTNYHKRTVIAFAVVAAEVSIIGTFHGGQDYAAVLHDR